MSDIANPPDIPRKPKVPGGETLGKLVRQCRKSQGLTMGDVASLWECSVSYVSDVENGEEAVRLRDLLLLMTHLYVGGDTKLEDVRNALYCAALIEKNNREVDIDWTRDQATGRTNSSPLFLLLVRSVAGIIRDSASDIVRGDLESVARVVLSHLAHRHHLAPRPDRVFVVQRAGVARYFISRRGAERYLGTIPTSEATLSVFALSDVVETAS